MGRKRQETALIKDVETGIWQIRYYDDKQGRSVFKSTETDDETLAGQRFIKFKETRQHRTTPGFNLTLSEMRVWWKLERRQRPTPPSARAEDTVDRAWSYIVHRAGSIRPSDPKAGDQIEALRDDLRDGVPGARQFADDDHAAIKEVLSYASVNAYLKQIRAIMRYCAKTKNPDTGKLIFPAGLNGLPQITMLKKPEGYKSRASAELSLDDDDVEALFAAAKAERVARGETRLSKLERLLHVLYWGGGQRGARVGLLRWDNVSLKELSIDFSNIPGIVNSRNKKGSPYVPIIPESPFLDFIKQAYEERGQDGEDGRYVLGEAMSIHAVSGRVRYTFQKVLGLKFGGSHVFRKSFATRLDRLGYGDIVHLILGISREICEKHYLKPSRRVIREAMAKFTGGSTAPTPVLVALRKKAGE